METMFLEGITQYGVIGGLLIFLVWQSVKREEKLMEFLNNVNVNLDRMSKSMEMMAEDQRDVRRKVGLEEFKSDKKER